MKYFGPVALGIALARVSVSMLGSGAAGFAAAEAVTATSMQARLRNAENACMI